MLLHVLSWNVFFEDYEYEKRTRGICQRILDISPDVVCLQEVTHPAWLIIKDILCSKYESAYKNPFINNTTARSYGEVILSKIPIQSKGFYILESYQGRVNTWIDIPGVRINTAHLESFQLDKYSLMRRKQLEMIKQNNQGKPWIWIGDSNMEKDESEALYKPLGKNTCTYHSKRYGRGDYEAEYDRVWSPFYPVQRWMKIDGEFLSDHDGILVEIDVKNTS